MKKPTKPRRLRLQEQWLSYRNEVLPQPADAVQLQETRRAFYAGAQAILNGIILRNLSDSPADQVTESDETMMLELQAELEYFGDRVKGGLA